MAKVESTMMWDDEEGLQYTETDYEMVTEVEWAEESYSFDLTRVYRQISTGDLFYAEDSGCSCPQPFEDTEDFDLTPIRRMQDWHDHVQDRIDDTWIKASSVDHAHHATVKVMDYLQNHKANNSGRTWNY